MLKNKNLIKVWQEASKDLKIHIEAPFVLKTDNTEIKYDLLIKEFGSKMGTLIITIDNMSDFDNAKKLGYYYSALNPFHYENYNRENFIETLTDWGYFGEQQNKPEWYEGYIYNSND